MSFWSSATISDWKGCYSAMLHFSKNHRMDQVGWDHSGSSDPTSLLKQVILERISQHWVQMVLEHHQCGRLLKLSGQPVPRLSHLHIKFFLTYKWNLLCIRVCLLSSCLTPPRRTSWHPLFIATYKYWLGPLWIMSSWGWTGPTLSAYPC